jgi:hypothetical protein
MSLLNKIFKTYLDGRKLLTYNYNVPNNHTNSYFLYTILLLGFISTQCLIDMIPITD